MSLQYNIQKYRNGSRDWYNKILDNVYLGAIPLKTSSVNGNQGTLNEIPNRLATEFNVCAIISCNEEFERCVTPSKDEWSKLGVELLKVNVADFNFAPELAQLIEAANFIDKYVQGKLFFVIYLLISVIIENKGVYIHCKAGRTRSATVLGAYLIIHHSHSPTSAYDFMKKYRSHVILHDVHQTALQKLYAHVHAS